MNLVFVRFTVAGAAQVKKPKRFQYPNLRYIKSLGFPLLPVELQHVNHTASTNIYDSKLGNCRKPYNHNSYVKPHANRANHR